MKTLGMILFFITLTLPMLHADEKIVSTVNNVDLIAVTASTNEKHGTEYFAHNHNTYTVKVSIKIKNSTNALNSLKPEPVIVGPNKREFLGSIAQEKTSVEAKWNLEWEVQQVDSSVSK